MFLILNVIGKWNPSRQQQQHSHKEEQRRDGEIDFTQRVLRQLSFMPDHKVLYHFFDY